MNVCVIDYSLHTLSMAGNIKMKNHPTCCRKKYLMHLNKDCLIKGELLNKKIRKFTIQNAQKQFIFRRILKFPAKVLFVRNLNLAII